MSISNGLEFITDGQIYQKVILEQIPKAQKYLWLATSDLKDLYVAEGKRMAPFLKILSELCQRGVELRLIHAKEPGPNFRKDFDRYPDLIEGLERLLCPRVHFKAVIVDGSFAYSGSANLTGAGMGAKSDDRRNFESGFITSDKYLVDKIMKQYDELWMGKHCESCQRKRYCAEYKDILDQ
ncbi:phospholipase D family protein [candidate division TA06 bacterium]|uniref:Phospholipase D family protein n=1 Tax=candidate division TA06 bacterium TaxID=2250710 RepID=A0A933IA48_UNCT6|nr:phospholipase D family protein [candidate division TA06 bacterium]